MQSPTTDDIDIRRIFHAGGLLAIVLIVSLFIAVAFPQIVGASESYVVTSDSMSPAIGAGSVVFVEQVPSDQLAKNDVITYRTSGDRADQVRVTHRIVEIRGEDTDREFKTRGDANAQPDRDWVPADNVIGVVVFSLPLIGYAVSFANSDVGLIVLVIGPASLLAISELWDLYQATATGSDKEDGRNA
ncbi:signal peptidase I [Halosimplex sp. J119]